MVAPDPKPAAAYLRRSTDKQEQSLSDQRKEIHGWAERHGYTVAAEYVDDAISGTSARSRPAFQRMIADAQNGRFAAVIVWNSDRFSRGDGDETGYYRHLLRQAGVTVLSVTEDFLAREGIDGDVLRAVTQFNNRQFSVKLSQNTLRGQISSVLGASDPGRMTPYGYDREVVGQDGSVLYRVRFREGGDREVYDRHGTLQAVYAKGQTLRKPAKECRARLVLSDRARVKVVREIFRMCAAGHGFKAIADELNRRGVLSPKGRIWQFTTVKAIIENPVYRGDLVWNRRSESKFFEVRQKRADQLKPVARSGRITQVAQDDWIVVEGAVPALVDRPTWDRAQAAAAARSECVGGRGRQNHRWLLSGVMRCACCGQPYWGIRKRKGMIAPGRKEVVKSYYICAGRTKCGKSLCPHPVHVPADSLEDWVLERVMEEVFTDGEGVREAVDRFIDAHRERTAGAIDTRPFQAEVKQIDRAVNAILDGLDPANLPLVNKRLGQMRRRREALMRQIRSAEATSEHLDEKALRRWATERLTLLAEMAAGRRDERTRQVIASYVNEIVINPADKTGYMVLNAGFPRGGTPDGPGDAPTRRRLPLPIPPPSGGAIGSGTTRTPTPRSGRSAVRSCRRGWTPRPRSFRRSQVVRPGRGPASRELGRGGSRVRLQVDRRRS